MNKEYAEKESLCFLQMLPEYTGHDISLLHSRFGSYTEAACADEKSLKKILTPDKVTGLIAERELKGIASAYAFLKSRNIGYAIPSDPDYPRRLLHIKGMPRSVFYIGKLPDDELPSVAIIGARNCSGYGRQMAREFAREIAGAGIQVISGMASGVDGIAQKAALAVGGATFGVLGCGVDICYPPENKELYEDLKEKGGLISEYIPGTKPIARQFPSRNRIISGLSDAILVIEARERSGTLITVGMALDQGREVYALPGRVTDSLSCGCNKLIWEGAVPLTKPYEFVDEFLEKCRSLRQVGCKTPVQRTIVSACDSTASSEKTTDDIRDKGALADSVHGRLMSADEELIMSVLDYNPKSAGEIIYELGDESKMSISEVLSLLTQMTVKHLISCIDGSNYAIRA